MNKSYILGNNNGHHTVESEVQEGEKQEEQVPKELCYRPFKTDHCIHDCTTENRLHKDIRDFNGNLQDRKS